MVSAYDTRPVVREQVESVGGRFVDFDVTGGDAEAAGGYARELTPEEIARLEEQGVVSTESLDSTRSPPPAPCPGSVSLSRAQPWPKACASSPALRSIPLAIVMLCCLTVVAWGDDWWEADVSDETFARTNLGDLRPGDRVNLERPVRLMDRLGGHVVQGHVDAVGTIVRGAPDLRVQMPRDLTRYVVEKGSITVDGISLTVVDALDDGFTCAIIPHTEDVTTLSSKGPGDGVNLEVDMMAKYAEKLLAGHLSR